MAQQQSTHLTVGTRVRIPEDGSTGQVFSVVEDRGQLSYTISLDEMVRVGGSPIAGVGGMTRDRLEVLN